MLSFFSLFPARVFKESDLGRTQTLFSADTLLLTYTNIQFYVAETADAECSIILTHYYCLMCLHVILTKLSWLYGISFVTGCSRVPARVVCNSSHTRWWPLTFRITEYSHIASLHSTDEGDLCILRCWLSMSLSHSFTPIWESKYKIRLIKFTLRMYS